MFDALLSCVRSDYVVTYGRPRARYAVRVRRTNDSQELLDGPLDAELLDGNLRDLARFNRLLGGSDISWRAVWNVMRATPANRELRVLDVGTGAGDIPVELVLRARRAGRRVGIVATDVRAEIVEAAASLVREPEIDVRLATSDLGDFGDASFDVVHSSLVLHHLEPAAATSVLGHMARVSRSAVIVNDLDRGWLWWAGAWLLSHALTGNRYTRHDAALSVHRAYRPGEMRELARAAGLTQVAQHWARPRYRYAITFVPRDSFRA
jgi:2-polyprenyl-3-methyl-5-hydroxy-6-metoxy-1,4-benzoquinol methylase